MAKWISGAIEHEGKLRKHFAVKEGENIPPEKIDAEIARLKGKADKTDDEVSLLRALLLAKRMRGFSHARKKG